MGHNHVMPFATNLKVFVALIALTLITVYTAKFVHLPGIGNIVLAMFIASIKGTLVLLWFMHLKGDSIINKAVIGSTVFFLALLFGIAYSDLFFR
jgi:cytochrome c oxidase subunit IV